MDTHIADPNHGNGLAVSWLRKWSPGNVVLISLSSLVVLILLYLVARQVFYYELHQNALGLAIATAAGIHASDVDSIRTAEDMNGDAYRRIQNLVQRVSRSNPDTHRFYIVRKTVSSDKHVASYEYVVDCRAKDSDGTGSVDTYEPSNPTGSRYLRPSHPRLERAWFRPTSEIEFLSMPFRGKYVSAYAPISTQRRETVGIVGVDLATASAGKKLRRLQIAIALVWLFLSSLAFVFSRITRKQWLGYLLVLVIISVLFSFLYVIARRVIINEIRYQAMGVAIAAAAGIEPEDVEAVRTREDVAGEAYQRLQQLMGHISDSNLDVRYMYIMRRCLKEGSKQSDYEYVVDEIPLDENGNGVIDPDEVSNPPGTYYDASRFPELVKAWSQPAADFDVSPDPPYPDLLSGYAPVKDHQGTTVGIVGVDVTAHVVRQKLLVMEIVIAIVWVTLSVMTLAVVHLYFQKRALLEERDKLVDTLRESRKKYKALSIMDPLTELYNSRHFRHQIRAEMLRARRYDRPLALLLMDIDDFKKYNDAHGHVAGDKVLARIGDVIRTSLRSSDTGYRFGGEEFVAVLPEADDVQATRIAERLRKRIEEMHVTGSKEDGATPVTVSIGVASYRKEWESVELVKKADHNMYLAKRMGKNRVFSG